MKFEVKWVGTARSGTGRIWGYLVDKNEEAMFLHYDYVKTFWGSTNGRIYFQTRKRDKAFFTNVSRKKYRYTETPALADKVVQEYEQEMILKKLRR